jgi:hypothetical protein
VPDVVPGRVELALVEVGVAVLDRRELARLVFVDEPDVDALREADPEAAVADLGDPVLPFRHAEEIVVEKMQLLRMPGPAPDFLDGVDRVRLTLLAVHAAEGRRAGSRAA